MTARRTPAHHPQPTQDAADQAAKAADRAARTAAQKEKFAWIKAVLLDRSLSASAKAVAAAAAIHCVGSKDFFKSTHRALAAHAGMSRRTVQRALDELTKHYYLFNDDELEAVPTGAAHTYTIIPPHERAEMWLQEESDHKKQCHKWLDAEKRFVQEWLDAEKRFVQEWLDAEKRFVQEWLDAEKAHEKQRREWLQAEANEYAEFHQWVYDTIIARTGDHQSAWDTATSLSRLRGSPVGAKLTGMLVSLAAPRDDFPIGYAAPEPDLSVSSASTEATDLADPWTSGMAHPASEMAHPASEMAHPASEMAHPASEMAHGVR